MKFLHAHFLSSPSVRFISISISLSTAALQQRKRGGEGCSGQAHSPRESPHVERVEVSGAGWPASAPAPTIATSLPAVTAPSMFPLFSALYRASNNLACWQGNIVILQICTVRAMTHFFVKL